MADRGGIAGMAERNDRHATLSGVGGLKALVGVLEVVIGFEWARHGYLNK
jgi:hypothetical protein